MQRIIRLGELKVEQFVQGTVNNWIVFSPLPYSKQHSSGIDGDIVIGTTPTLEVIDADLDVTIPAGYTYSYSIATDNKLKIAADKAVFTDKSTSFDLLKCLSIVYELGNLTPNGNYYRVIIINSLGEEVHRTTPLTIDQIEQVIKTFAETRDIQASGFVEYKIVQDFIVS